MVMAMMKKLASCRFDRPRRSQWQKVPSSVSSSMMMLMMFLLQMKIVVFDNEWCSDHRRQRAEARMKAELVTSQRRRIRPMMMMMMLVAAQGTNLLGAKKAPAKGSSKPPYPKIITCFIIGLAELIVTLFLASVVVNSRLDLGSRRSSSQKNQDP